MTYLDFEKEYIKDRPTEPYSDDDSPNDWANITHYAEENLKKAFKRIVELEKENAELKEKQKWLGSSTKCWFTNSPCRSCDEHDERLKRLGLCYIGQLNKAKDIIKKLTESIRFLNSHRNTELSDVNEFLKDVEKFIKRG